MSTLINVCGDNRSGTTMLDLMLGNAREAFSCGEVYAWFRPWRRHHFKLECSCNEMPCPYWEKFKNISENDFHKSLFEKLGIQFVVDSSKEISWVIDNNNWAVANGINVVNLLLWKNPIDLAYSHWKRGGGRHGWRKSFLSYYKKFFQAGIPFVSVNYNALASTPNKTLGEICNVVGIEYFEGKERFWEKKHHYLFGSLGIRKQLEDKMNIEIRKPGKFPDDFKKDVSCLESKIKGDKKIQKTLETLRKRDVSKIITLDSYVQERRKTHRIYPIWYYTDRLKRIYKKRFPKKLTE
jgi:hypothetical protein